MIANIRLYLLLLLGLIPLILLGSFQIIYAFINPGKFPLSSVEPYIVGLVIFYDAILFLMVIIDLILSIRPDEIVITREVAEKLSINRLNPVKLKFSNFSSQDVIGVVKDDHPDIPALQVVGDKELKVNRIKITLAAASKGEMTYFLKPTYRGNYEFGDIQLRYISRFKLFWRQVKIKQIQNIKVYPDLMGLNELAFKLTR